MGGPIPETLTKKKWMNMMNKTQTKGWPREIMEKDEMK